MLEFKTFHEWCVYSAYRGDIEPENLFKSYFNYIELFVSKVIDIFNVKYCCGKVLILSSDRILKTTHYLLDKILVYVNTPCQIDAVLFEDEPDWYYCGIIEEGSERWGLFRPTHLVVLWNICCYVHRNKDNTLDEFEDLDQKISDLYDRVVQRYGI